MGSWYTNPVVWIGAITALLIVGRVVFQIGQWKGNVDETQTAVKAFMDEVRNDLRKIHDRIDDVFGRLPPVEVRGDSPLRLTDLGRKLSECLQASALADALVPPLRAQVAGKSPYEVQEFCFKYTAHEYQPEDDLEARIQMCAYENGVKRHQVLRVLAIELRDRLLSRQEG